MTVPAELQHFPLEEAYQCLDCDEICNCQDVCPKCGGTTFHPVAKWLNRKESGDE